MPESHKIFTQRLNVHLVTSDLSFPLLFIIYNRSPLGTHVSNHQENNWPQEFRHWLSCTKSFKGNEKRCEFPRVRGSDSGVGPWPLSAVLSRIQHLAAQSFSNDVQQKVLLTPKIHPPPFSLNIHSQIFSNVRDSWRFLKNYISQPPLQLAM